MEREQKIVDLKKTTVLYTKSLHFAMGLAYKIGLSVLKQQLILRSVSIGGELDNWAGSLDSDFPA